MRRALATASAVIMTTDEAARRVRDAFPELGNRVFSIPNGFDADDFSGVILPRRDGKFRIVHTGTLHTDGVQTGVSDRLRRTLGGEILGVDVATRSHVQLAEAVRALRDEDPDLGEQIEVHLAGAATAADRDATGDCPFVQFHGYLPHSKSISLLRSGDLLFLPMHRIRSGERAGIVPGKTYEYLAAGRPILAAVPEGDARDIVTRAGTGLVCDPGDIRAMKALIRDQLVRWRAGDAAPQLQADYVGQFERRALTARLVELMHGAVELHAGWRVAV